MSDWMPWAVGAVVVVALLLVVDQITRKARARHPRWGFWWIGVGWAGLIGMVVAASIPVGIVVMLAAAVVAALISGLGRPRKPQRVVQPGAPAPRPIEALVPPPEVQRAHRIMLDLPDVAVALGLAMRDDVATDLVRRVDDPTDLGSILQAKKAHTIKRDPAVRILRGTVWRVPTVERWAGSDAATTLWVRLPAGLTVDTAQKAGDALAQNLRAHRVTITQDPAERAAGVARLVVLHFDPLVGVRESVPVGDPSRLVVGRYEDGAEVVVSLTDASHIAIQGMTRSGKSALLYTLLSQVATCPWVVVGGIDPNRVLLSPWRAVPRSAPWLSVGSDPESAAALLSRYVAEMDRRLDLLDERGIDALREFSDQDPLLVCVLEEYPALLKRVDAEDQSRKPAERVGPRVRSAVSRLVMEGAKSGIRVVLIAQRMDASIVDGAVRGQFGTRLTLAVDNGDGVRMLHPEVSPETIKAVTEAPPGRVLVWLHRVERFAQGDLTEYPVYRDRVMTSNVEGKGACARGSTGPGEHGAPAPAA